MGGGLAVSLWLTFQSVVSYWWFSAITTFSTVAVGLLASQFFPARLARELGGLTAWHSLDREAQP